MNNLTSMAYLVVIAVWSTTPLAIKWSSSGLHPLWGLALRIIIATLGALILVQVWRRPIPLHRQALKNYVAGGLGLFGGLIFVYIGAAYVPSGLVSVLYGLSPMLSGILAYYIIDDPPFSAARWLALLLSISGLSLIFLKEVQFNQDMIKGVVLVLISVLFFCTSGVLIKKYHCDAHPLSQTTGSLLVCMPLFLVCANAFAGDISYDAIQLNTKLSILYLALIGSILGMLCYYYILGRMTPSSVALTTVITPVIALFLGVYLNGEEFSRWVYLGAILIIIGLVFYNWGDRILGNA